MQVLGEPQNGGALDGADAAQPWPKNPASVVSGGTAHLQKLLAETTDRKEGARHALPSQGRDMINTWCGAESRSKTFERKGSHTERRNGEPHLERICEILDESAGARSFRTGRSNLQAWL